MLIVISVGLQSFYTDYCYAECQIFYCYARPHLADCQYSEYHYGECLYADFCYSYIVIFIIKLSFLMVSVIMLSAKLLMLC